MLGDPPIDWDAVETRHDHESWLYQRSTYPAAVLQTEVLDRGRRALVLYGQMHLQRRNLLGNYALVVDDPRLYTLVQQLEQAEDVSVLTVWVNVRSELQELQPDVVSWPVPSLAFLRGTRLGVADFTFYYSSDVPRATVQDGRILPIPRDQWVSLTMEDQFDAVLYLGSPSTMTTSQPSPELCGDSTYMEMRRTRLTLLGLQPVLDELERWCLDHAR